MFEQTFVEAAPAGKKGASMLVSVLAQLLVLCVLIAIPIIYTHGLPKGVLKAFLVAPPVPHAAPVETPERTTQAVRTQPRLLNIHNLVSRPSVAVTSQRPVISGAAPDIGVPGGSENTSDGGIVGSGLFSVSQPAPEPAKPSAAPAPLRVGGHAEEANLIRKVMPAYPPLAKSARVQGSVEFTALISKAGTIENLQLVRGHPLLVQAAREAVLQWRYRPTLLNGVPVEVVTDITVNFTLAQ